ncbi:MAG TPA: GtrA family protein, partial [Roseateles sp.]
MHAEVIHADAKPRLAQRGRVRWFLLVGCAAAAVHWVTVVALVGHAGWRPLTANVVGWLAAVGVSFLGHHLRTFRGHGGRLLHALPRFLLLSASGFAINESVYALLLRGGHRYDLVLAVVLVGVAGITYRLS